MTQALLASTLATARFFGMLSRRTASPNDELPFAPNGIGRKGCLSEEKRIGEDKRMPQPLLTGDVRWAAGFARAA